MLAPTLEATTDLDVTVAYAATPRPFDAAGLRAISSPRADVVLVEPYLPEPPDRRVVAALADVLHRLLGLGVPRDRELRRYGTMADHAAAHCLDAAGISPAIRTSSARSP